MPSLNDVTRVDRTREQAARSYDRLSHVYDRLIDPLERRPKEHALEALAPRAGERILEIGPGTGWLLAAVARAVGPAGLALGVDLSAGMCRRIRQALSDAGTSTWTSALRGDGVALPLRTGSMDAVCSTFTLELFDTPDIPRVLEECRRVLAPGGRMVLLTMAKDDRVSVKIYEWLHQRMPSVLDCRPIRARRAVIDAGFHLRVAHREKMWGVLPADLVVAQRP